MGGLTLTAGWHWLFLINLPIAVLVLWLSWRVLPAARPAKTGRSMRWGMLVLAAALSSLAIAINQIDTANVFSSLGSVNVLPFFLIAIALVPLLIRIEKRSSNPILRLDLFSNRQMVLSYILALGAGIGESGLVFMPSLAVAAFMIQSSEASFMLVPLVIAMAVISPAIGWLLDRLGSKIIVLGGTFLLAAGLFFLGGLASRSVALFLLSGVLVGCGLSSLLGAPIRYIMLNEAPPMDRSVAQGIVTLSGSIGRLIGSALVGAVAASTGGSVAGFSNAYLVVGVISIPLIWQPPV